MDLIEGIKTRSMLARKCADIGHMLWEMDLIEGIKTEGPGETNPELANVRYEKWTW